MLITKKMSSSSPPHEQDENGFASDDNESVHSKMKTPSPSNTPTYDLPSPDQVGTPPPESYGDTPPSSPMNDDDGPIKKEASNPKDKINGAKKSSAWIAYLDDEQRTYYHNSETGESSWEAPDDYIPVEDAATADEATTSENADKSEIEEEKEIEEKEEEGEAPDETPPGTPTGTPEYSDGAMTPQQAGSDNDNDDEEKIDTSENKEQIEKESNAWVAYKDDNGAEYYYNTITQATQWERPEGMTDDVADSNAMEVDEIKEEGSITPGKTSPSAMNVDYNEKSGEQQQNNDVEEKEIEEEEEVEDPSEKTIREANEFIEKADSIFEPDCNKHVGNIIELRGPSGGTDMMKKLISSYRGHTSMCGLLALWLTDLTTATKSSSTSLVKANDGDFSSSTSKSNDYDLRQKAADSIRETSVDVINKIAKEKFNRKEGDDILELVTSSRRIRFLEDMIDSDSWRRLLIDLSAKNKDSALLMVCLQRISKRGHNRDIAQRINPSDYFGVFNSMLASELSILGKIAVGGVLDSNDHDGIQNSNNKKDSEAFNDIDELVSNFKRICTSNAYTYFYAMQFLQYLVMNAKKRRKSDDVKADAIERAIRKWERLREELEEEMMRPKSTSSESHLAKRRRVDISLRLNDLYQRQRKRLKPENISHDQKKRKNPVEQKLDTAVIDLLRRHSMGIKIDETFADSLLIPHTLLQGQEQSIGELLIAHPYSIKALVINLFKPARVMTLNLRQKCSKLLAKAIIASKKTFNLRSEDHESEDEEEIRLWKMILQGSQLCKEVENMVSFTVTDYKELPHGIPSGASVGGKLSFMCIKSASVAQGVLFWITEMASGPDFDSSAAYPTLSPSLLSLSRIIAKYHPFARPEVLRVTFLFLEHKSPELSYERVKALKQQLLRLLLWLSTWSQALGVFGYFAKNLRQGGSGAVIDSSLLRYFMSGVLEVIHPPFSVPLVKVLNKMFATKACIEAVNSPHFHETKKTAFRELLQEFEKTFKEEKRMSKSASSVSKEDVKSVESLRNIYA